MRKISQLAINDEGFVFDPLTGDSYQVSETGLIILRQLADSADDEAIAKSVSDEFDVSEEDALTDIGDFRDRLKRLGLA